MLICGLNDIVMKVELHLHYHKVLEIYIGTHGLDQVVPLESWIIHYFYFIYDHPKGVQGFFSGLDEEHKRPDNIGPTIGSNGGNVHVLR